MERSGSGRGRGPAALAWVLAACVGLAACGAKDSSPDLSCRHASQRPVITPGWYSTFAAWLNANGYGHLAANQGFGGYPGCAGPRRPLILVHGADLAADPSGNLSGVRSELAGKFSSSGAAYLFCDFFAITWSEPATDVSQRHHRANSLILLRDFIQAVKGYTGATQVDVLAVSMGVAMARKAITGGMAYNSTTRTPESGCDIGPSLAPDIGTFLGVAGINRGMSLCTGRVSNACSPNGFTIDSAFLQDLNGGSGGTYAPAPLADRVYSIVLPDDEEICGDNPRGFGPQACEVFGAHTSHIPGEHFSKSYDIDNTLYVSRDPSPYCLDTDRNGQLNCDHVLVFADPTSLDHVQRLLRDHDTGI